MKYTLVAATESETERLIKYKLATTIKRFMGSEEKTKIINYVTSHIPKQLSSYQLIKAENKIVGALRVLDYEDGVLVDEIFIEKEFRNKGIGTSIFKNILKENNVVYLWVYKTNTVARNLYLKLGFKTISTDGRKEFMQYKA